MPLLFNYGITQLMSCPFNLVKRQVLVLFLALFYDFTCVVWTCFLVYFVAAVSHVLCFYV